MMDPTADVENESLVEDKKRSRLDKLLLERETVEYIYQVPFSKLIKNPNTWIPLVVMCVVCVVVAETIAVLGFRIDLILGFGALLLLPLYMWYHWFPGTIIYVVTNYRAIILKLPLGKVSTESCYYVHMGEVKQTDEHTIVFETHIAHLNKKVVVLKFSDLPNASVMYNIINKMRGQLLPEGDIPAIEGNSPTSASNVHPIFAHKLQQHLQDTNEIVKWTYIPSKFKTWYPSLLTSVVLTSCAAWVVVWLAYPLSDGTIAALAFISGLAFLIPPAVNYSIGNLPKSVVITDKSVLLFSRALLVHRISIVPISRASISNLELIGTPDKEHGSLRVGLNPHNMLVSVPNVHDIEEYIFRSMTAVQASSGVENPVVESTENITYIESPIIS